MRKAIILSMAVFALTLAACSSSSNTSDQKNQQILLQHKVQVHLKPSTLTLLN